MPPQRRRPVPPEPDPTDDIEILEVVGVDENGTPVGDDADAEADEVVLEFEEPEAAAPAPGPAVDAEELRQLRDRLLRLQADFENFKKRMERERLDHLRHATSDLLGRILPVLDNFERAMASFRSGGSADAMLEGIALIHRQLLQELEKEGLRGMDSVGDPFDPSLHEAVATDPDPAMPAHTVTHVFQRGYFLHERLLRPAMVRVRIGDGDDGASPEGGRES